MRDLLATLYPKPLMHDLTEQLREFKRTNPEAAEALLRPWRIEAKIVKAKERLDAAQNKLKDALSQQSQADSRYRERVATAQARCEEAIRAAYVEFELDKHTDAAVVARAVVGDEESALTAAIEEAKLAPVPEALRSVPY